MKHRSLVFFLIGLSAILITACSSAGDLAPTPLPTATAERAATVILTLDPKLQGETLLIEGETDLPDGTLIAYQYQHKTDYSIEFIKGGNAAVTKGKYQAAAELSGWPEGEIEVWAAFQTILEGEQPPEVIARFGKLGENMQGDNVTISGEMRRVELTKSVRLGQ